MKDNYGHEVTPFSGSANIFCDRHNIYYDSLFIISLADLYNMQKCYKFLQKLHSKYKEEVVSSVEWTSIEETKQVLDQREICISVFGQHNCGKSTFLNAFIGYK